MPVDPCLPVPLGGIAPHDPTVHRIHHIIGRIRRHGTARHVGVKRAVAPLDGCGKVASGIPGALPGAGKAAPAFLPKIIPAVATGGALIGGGSGVIGGFGGGGGGVVTTPGGGGGGTPHCTGVSCNPGGGGGTPVPEPASFLMLGAALLVVTLCRKTRSHA